MAEAQRRRSNQSKVVLPYLKVLQDDNWEYFTDVRGIKVTKSKRHGYTTISIIHIDGPKEYEVKAKSIYLCCGANGQTIEKLK